MTLRAAGWEDRFGLCLSGMLPLGLVQISQSQGRGNGTFRKTVMGRESLSHRLERHLETHLFSPKEVLFFFSSQVENPVSL